MASYRLPNGSEQPPSDQFTDLLTRPPAPGPLFYFSGEGAMGGNKRGRRGWFYEAGHTIFKYPRCLYHTTHPPQPLKIPTNSLTFPHFNSKIPLITEVYMNTAADLIFGIEEPPPTQSPELPQMTLPEPELAEPAQPPMVTPNVQLWDPNLPFEVAMGLDDTETILDHFSLTPQQFEVISAHPLYRRELSEHIKDLRENGLSYKTKAKVMAEEYLLDLHSIVKSSLATQSTKLDAIKYVTKVAELEPVKGVEAAGNNTVNIQINI